MSTTIDVLPKSLINIIVVIHSVVVRTCDTKHQDQAHPPMMYFCWASEPKQPPEEYLLMKALRRALLVVIYNCLFAEYKCSVVIIIIKLGRLVWLLAEVWAKAEVWANLRFGLT